MKPPHQSPTPKGVWESNKWNNEVTSSISELLKFLMNSTRQFLLCPSTCLSNNDSTEAFLSMTISNSTGNISFKGWSPHQIPCQNWIQLPEPRTNWMHRKKWSPFILMLLQYPQPWVHQTGFDNHPPHSSPFFTISTCLQNFSPPTQTSIVTFPTKIDWKW